MKVLIVCSGNSEFGISPFIKEQGESLEKIGVSIDYFLIKGHGLFGYLKNLPRLNKQIKKIKYDLIHAHYGLSGMLSVLQRKIPVIITFHGSDINNSYIRKFSKIAMRLSSYNIFVHKSIKDKANATIKSSIIPCGVNLDNFQVINKSKARIEMHLNSEQKYVLFAGSFDNWVKNSELAFKVIKTLPEIEMIELKGYTRDQVCLLMNAVNLLLLTSFSEGSPQVIKEAMACNLPIVSTDVGDVKEIIGDTEGCYICSYDPTDVAEKIKMALLFGKRTNGRKRIIELGLDSDSIAKKIIDVYQEILYTK